MNNKNTPRLALWVVFSFVAIMGATAIYCYFYPQDSYSRYMRKWKDKPDPAYFPTTNLEAERGAFTAPDNQTNPDTPAPMLATEPRPVVRKKMADLSPAERDAFATNFVQRYRPAIIKWAKAFNGHLPLDLDRVTADKVNQRVGYNPESYEYIFVVNGVTLGVADSKDSAAVDYLNDGRQTGKLSTMPNASHAPTLAMPLTKQDIVSMVNAESGANFAESDIRLTPTGLSGSMDGGMYVEVGGIPQNSVTWKYNMVFGPDGKLAYYTH